VTEKAESVGIESRFSSQLCTIEPRPVSFSGHI
jgi:hypothetical protein